MATSYALHPSTISSASSHRKRQSSGWDSSTRPSSNAPEMTRRSFSRDSSKSESPLLPISRISSVGRSTLSISHSNLNDEDEELIARFVDSLPQECLNEARGLSRWSAREAAMALLKRLLDLRKDNARLRQTINLQLTRDTGDATLRISSCAGSPLARMARDSESMSHRNVDDMQLLHEQQIEALHEHYRNLIREQDEELDSLHQAMEELDAEKPKLTGRRHSRQTYRSSHHLLRDSQDMQDLGRQKCDTKPKVASEMSESERRSELSEPESPRQVERETWLSLSRKLDLANEDCAKTLDQVVALKEQVAEHRSTIQKRDSDIVELTRMMEEEKKLRLQSEEKLTNLLQSGTEWGKWFSESLLQDLAAEVRQMSGTLGELTNEVVSNLAKASISRAVLRRSLKGHYVTEDGTVFASLRSCKTLLPATLAQESQHLNAGLMHATALLQNLRNAIDDV